MKIDRIVRTFAKGYSLNVSLQQEDQAKTTYRLYRISENEKPFWMDICVLNDTDARNLIEVTKYLFETLEKIRKMQKEEGIILLDE